MTEGIIMAHVNGWVGDLLNWSGLPPEHWVTLNALDSSPDTYDIIGRYAGPLAVGFQRLASKAVIRMEDAARLASSGMTSHYDEVWFSRVVPDAVPPRIDPHGVGEHGQVDMAVFDAIYSGSYDGCAVDGGGLTIVATPEFFQMLAPWIFAENRVVDVR